MSPTTYRFAEAFTVPAAQEAVHATLADLEHYVDWWPQVRAVARVDDDHALVVCRSALPYDLELGLTAVRRDPGLLEVGIDGPIRGWARFGLAPDGSGGPGHATRLVFEQQVRAEAPMMVLASYAVKPVLAWNHRQMMRGARDGLRGRLAGGGQPSAASAAS